MAIILEKSPSGRAGCDECGKLINKGELRVGKLTSYGSYSYSHASHLSSKSSLKNAMLKGNLLKSELSLIKSSNLIPIQKSDLLNISFLRNTLSDYTSRMFDTGGDWLYYSLQHRTGVHTFTTNGMSITLNSAKIINKVLYVDGIIHYRGQTYKLSFVPEVRTGHVAILSIKYSPISSAPIKLKDIYSEQLKMLTK